MQYLRNILPIKKYHIVIFFMVLFLGIEQSQAKNFEVSEKQVKSFMKLNRGNVLVGYKCNSDDSKINCRVVCNSGDEKFIDVKNVHKAYSAERLKKFDDSVDVFYLVIDIDKTENDIWARLKNNSSCYFEGMTPVL